MVVAECRSDLIPFYLRRGYVQVGTQPILSIIPATSVTRPDLLMVELEKMAKTKDIKETNGAKEGKADRTLIGSEHPKEKSAKIELN